MSLLYYHNCSEMFIHNQIRLSRTVSVELSYSGTFTVKPPVLINRGMSWCPVFFYSCTIYNNYTFLTVRLKSRGVTNLGTVEIRTDAGWVQVCDEDWDRQDALVVCREQNFNNGTALTGSKLGKVSTHDSMPNVAFR